MGGEPSKILESPALWLGGKNVILQDNQFLPEHDVTAVLSVCQIKPSEKYTTIVRRLHVNVDDIPEADLTAHFWNCVEFIHISRLEGRNVYVHCAAGISRSTSMVCAYLMTHLGMSFDFSLKHVSQCRPIACPNDGFQRQLRDYQKHRRDECLHRLHSIKQGSSAALLQSDWAYVTSLKSTVDVEGTQKKVFRELMKRKQEAGEEFGLEWLRDRMQAQGITGDEDQAAPAQEQHKQPTTS